MEALRQTQKKYCSRALATAVFAGFFFILIGQNPVGKGLILGTLFSILNFIIMGETIPLKLNKSKGKTLFFSISSVFFRYIILAVPLVMALKLEQFNFLAVVVGIFFVQIFILADTFLDMALSGRGKQI
jgi:hypothetical protein